MSEDPDELDPTALPSTEPATPSIGDLQQIGPYRMLQKLGEGGMGEVWEAEQEKPVRRKVALKLIKAGMDTKQVVARFEAERQALAMMSHASIARVFDAGATEWGRPYFAMEYVKGEPITRYCDRHRLPTRERLELFMQICEGVQHAHQKGIIHRDLKPSNVLVQIEDDRPVPKIIDFGVAKATEQRLTEKTLFTQMGVLVGTPEYMSPEQAEMGALDIDTRTDVYSLGVMLYELLIGALPFEPKELRQVGFDELRRKIREDEPSRPSTRISTLGAEASTASARDRRTDLSALRKQLRGDLDWITLKALDKDRTRRYGSPNELAADIGRHLRHEPVLASPPSATYRAGKFVRRHKVGVAAAGVVLLVVLLGLGGTTYGLIRATRAEAQARQEAATAEQVSGFLTDMLGTLDPQVLGVALWKDLLGRVAEARRGRGAAEEEIEVVLASLGEAFSGVSPTDAAVRLLDEQILVPAAETIERELSQEPRIAGRLEHTLGATYERLGLMKQAAQHFERAVDFRDASLGPEHPLTLSSRTALGEVYWQSDRESDSEALLRETAEIQSRVLGKEHPDTLWSGTHLGWAYIRLGRFEEAENVLGETLESQRRVLGDEHVQTLTSMNALSGVHWYQGRLAEAETLQRETLDTTRRVLGAEHPKTLSYMNTLSVILSSDGRHAEAEELARAVLATRRRVLGAEHPSTVAVTSTLASNLVSQGRHAEAELLCLDALEGARLALGEEHQYTRMIRNNLAAAYEGAARYADAEKTVRGTLEIERRALGPTHRATRGSMYHLGRISMLRGDREAALDWFGQAAEHGFSRADWMTQDPELDDLRGDPEFERLVARVRENQGPK